RAAPVEPAGPAALTDPNLTVCLDRGTEQSRTGIANSGLIPHAVARPPNSRLSRVEATPMLKPISVDVHTCRLPTRMLALVLVSSCAAVAPPQQPLGIIVGTVTDATGARLAGVTITVTNSETQTSRTVLTSATG